MRFSEHITAAIEHFAAVKDELPKLDDIAKSTEAAEARLSQLQQERDAVEAEIAKVKDTHARNLLRYRTEIETIKNEKAMELQSRNEAVDAAKKRLAELHNQMLSTKSQHEHLQTGLAELRQKIA